jgi:hypothetical protein
MDEATFVVRIYRGAHLTASVSRAGSGRRRHDRTALSGVIEEVEFGERQAFHDIEELWAILCRTVPNHPRRE